MAYSDNVITQIKKGSVTYDVKDVYADSRLTTIQGDANTEGSIAKAEADAKAYADGLATNYDPTGTAAGVQSTVIGANTDTGLDNTIYGAKAYADGLATNYDPTGTAANVQSTVIGAGTDTGSADTIYGAKAYAKSYADGLATNYDPTGTAANVQSAVIGNSSDTGSVNTIYGAKAYAKGLVDTILGEDSASSTLASLKNIIQELNDPANQNGIAGTFIDSVKSDLAGLTKSDGNGGTTGATVKEYVDNSIASNNATISGTTLILA